MTEKYGLPLTGSDWAGLPLRVGHFERVGQVEDLHGASDGILCWGGGVSEVTIDSSCASDKITRTTFTRRAGMIDLLPKGTTLYNIRWSGEASTCISVNLPELSRQQLLTDTTPGLNPELGPQLGLLDGHVADLVGRLRAQAESSAPMGPAYAQGLSLTLAAYVLARYSSDQRGSSPPSRTLPGQTRQALVEFVEAHLAHNISLVDMALVAGYSPDHFAKLFKVSFGVSPHRYLLSRRVERAKALLRQPRLSIAEVAVSCGFASQPHLNEVFKRMTGITPGAFRRG